MAHTTGKIFLWTQKATLYSHPESFLTVQNQYNPLKLALHKKYPQKFGKLKIYILLLFNTISDRTHHIESIQMQNTNVKPIVFKMMLIQPGQCMIVWDICKMSFQHNPCCCFTLQTALTQTFFVNKVTLANSYVVQITFRMLVHHRVDSIDYEELQNHDQTLDSTLPLAPVL